VASPAAAGAAAMPIEGTIAGRAFAAVQPVSIAPSPDERVRWWHPLLDGAERLGVVEVTAEPAVAGATCFRAECDTFVALLGHLVMIKKAYGDSLIVTRRTTRMSCASELLWHLLPPLTFATDRLVISAILEPTYEVGGDGFDYAVDADTAHFAILDTTGHGIRAGVGTSVALAAIRSARRADDELTAQAEAVDAVFASELDDRPFTTAVLARLALDTGVLTYVNAGHPAPLLLRNNRVVRRLDRGRRLPLGIDDPHTAVDEEALEPGDRLLCFTDGVVDARNGAGEPFGEGRLIDLAERQEFARLPAPETLRRLAEAVASHLDQPPADDATLLFVEWSGAARGSGSG
jgi:phosphoserine phosphatase RsbU/P